MLCLICAVVHGQIHNEDPNKVASDLEGAESAYPGPRPQFGGYGGYGGYGRGQYFNT